MRRKLAEALSKDGATSPAPASMAKIGLSLGSGSQSEDHWMYPIPVTGGSQDAIPMPSANGQKCHFLMDFQTGPSCEDSKCPKSRMAWVEALDGKVISKDCKVRACFRNHRSRGLAP